MSKTIKKSINISEELVKRIDKAINSYPGLTFTLVVNQALEQWLRGPQTFDLTSFKEREYFIKDNSKGFGPRGRKK